MNERGIHGSQRKKKGLDDVEVPMHSSISTPLRRVTLDLITVEVNRRHDTNSEPARRLSIVPIQ